MDEGVDPTRMCQTLVDKVARSKQLQTVTDPEILALFENWLDELEDEVIAAGKNNPALDAQGLARRLGLSRRGIVFLLTKLQKENRI